MQNFTRSRKNVREQSWTLDKDTCGAKIAKLKSLPVKNI